MEKFPRYEIVKIVMLERRGEQYFNSWKNKEDFGSLWISGSGLYELMENCKTDREAEILLHYIFSLSDSKDEHAHQTLNNLLLMHYHLQNNEDLGYKIT